MEDFNSYDAGSARETDQSQSFEADYEEIHCTRSVTDN